MNNDHITEAYESTRRDAAVFGMQEQFAEYSEAIQMSASQNALNTLDELGIPDTDDYHYYLYACMSAEGLEKEAE